MDTYDGEQRGYDGNNYHTAPLLVTDYEYGYHGHSEIDLQASNITIAYVPALS